MEQLKNKTTQSKEEQINGLIDYLKRLLNIVNNKLQDNERLKKHMNKFFKEYEKIKKGVYSKATPEQLITFNALYSQIKKEVKNL